MPFKFSSKEGVLNAARMSYQSKNNAWFEALKGVKVEDKAKCKGEEGTLKKMMQKTEANQRIILTEMKIGRGMCKNDVLLMMSKDCKNKGRDWIRENHGVNFKLKEEKHAKALRLR